MSARTKPKKTKSPPPRSASASRPPAEATSDVEAKTLDLLAREPRLLGEYVRSGDVAEAERARQAVREVRETVGLQPPADPETDATAPEGDDGDAPSAPPA